MRILLLLFSLILFVSPLFPQKKPVVITASGSRTEKNLNSSWTFNYFPAETADKGYEASRFNDSKWPAISLPHTWLTYETTGELHPFIYNPSATDNPYWLTGWGWYRKHFTINGAEAEKKIFVEFEGVQKYCKVWINGKYLGDHKGGYGSFDFDITPHIRPGEDNVLAIAVNNRKNDQFSIPPMAAGNFNVYGGIYRDVKIVIKDKLYIPMQGSASHEGGTFITTPGLTAKEGVVRIQTWVKNDNIQKKSCLLRSSVVDATGKVVLFVETTADINPGQLYKFDQVTKPVKSPHLWSPEDPYMYKVTSEVFDGKKGTDMFSSPLGFRWFRWDYKDNFLYVNGKKTILYGGNRHQEYPWLGDATPKWITEMDYADMAENLNYNFIRTAHYPNDQIVYDLTDKYGIITDEESPSSMNQNYSQEVQDQQMKEMIRRDRNHPSIMFWGMGNDTDHAVDSKFAVAEDTTRILTARKAVNGSAGKYVKHTDDNLALESLSQCTIRGWYNRDVKNYEPADGQQSGTEEFQQNMLKNSGRFGTGNLITWLYADHGNDREYLNSPLLHVNPKGYVDMYRIPKYAYYFWQATYSEKLMAFIQPHFWRSQYLGQKKDIIVNSNCDKVELKVNGTSKGILSPDESNFHSVTFKDITIEQGTLSVTGTKGGKTITSQVVMASGPAKIVLKSSHQAITADRGSVVIITADITDSKGNHVYGASNNLKWIVSGPAVLVGPTVYESDINKVNSSEGVWYIDMPVSNVIRSTGLPGKIKVTVVSSGLSSGSVEITANESKASNQSITEPPLTDDGRKPVARVMLINNRLDEIPKDIKFSETDFVATLTNRTALAGSIRDYIISKNPGVDTTSVEFKTLISLFATQLVNNNGKLVAEDYNFNVDHYNNCRLILTYINATKLPPLFKEGMRGYYAESIIHRGAEKNAGDEMNWLNWIPSGGTVVIYNEKQGTAIPKGAIASPKSNLTDLIALVHPTFPGFSDEAKERALVFIGKMNPYIHQNVVSSKDKDGKSIITTTYSAESGKTILIPLIKFIAE